MNLVQFLFLVLFFVLLFLLLFKNKKKLDEINENIFRVVFIVLWLILGVFIINSGIFSKKLPESFGGGARYTPKMEENVKEMGAPKLKIKTKIEYKKEGERSLKEALSDN